MNISFDKLPDDLLYYIYEFLNNQSIIYISSVNKRNHFLVYDTIFREFLTMRTHPLTFNSLDNLCSICNIGLYVIDEKCFFEVCTHKEITDDQTNLF
jgi:hypothetical protein